MATGTMTGTIRRRGYAPACERARHPNAPGVTGAINPRSRPPTNPPGSSPSSPSRPQTANGARWRRSVTVYPRRPRGLTSSPRASTPHHPPRSSPARRARGKPRRRRSSCWNISSTPDTGPDAGSWCVNRGASRRCPSHGASRRSAVRRLGTSSGTGCGGNRGRVTGPDSLFAPRASYCNGCSGIQRWRISRTCSWTRRTKGRRMRTFY